MGLVTLAMWLAVMCIAAEVPVGDPRNPHHLEGDRGGEQPHMPGMRPQRLACGSLRRGQGRSSAFQRAGQARDNAPLGEDEEAERRHHRQRGEREDARRVLGILGLERGHTQRQREVLRAGEHDVGKQVVVPAEDERQDRDRDQRGRDSGSRIRAKNFSLVAPSITAASSISAGIARMNGRRITIVMDSENAASGIATPNRLSSMWMRCSSR